MADNDNDKEIKDLEKQLFEEFSEQINLSEPSDSRLQENVELNPDIKQGKDKKVEEPKEEKKENVAKEDKSEKDKEDLSNVDLGQAFAEVVSKDEKEAAEKKDTEEDSHEDSEQIEEPKNTLLSKTLYKSKVYVKKSSFILNYLKKAIYFVSSPFRWFLSLSLKEKFFFLLIIIGFTFVSILSYQFYIKYYVEANKSPYLNSYYDLEGAEYIFDNSKDFQIFFSPAYMPDYAYVLPKVMANIKPSINSGNNPMVFVEVVLKGSNQDTAIEFKDRQVEIHDRTARVIEGFSFDDIRTVNGKEKLKKELTRTVNQMLNNGTVIDVLFRNFIVKP